MDDLITDSRYSWTRLGLTLFVATVINAGMWVIIVIMPAIEAEYGGTRAMASLPYTLTMVGFALGNYVIGRAVDHFGITASLIVAATMTAIGFGLATLSSSLLVLSFTQFLVGFASAVGFGPLIADISHWFVRRRGIAVAIAASGKYLSGCHLANIVGRGSHREWLASCLHRDGGCYTSCCDTFGVCSSSSSASRSADCSAKHIVGKCKDCGSVPSCAAVFARFCGDRLLCGYVDASSSHCCLLC